MKFVISIRSIVTSASLSGKRNFRKFVIPERGSNIFKARQRENPDKDIPPYKFVPKETGYFENGKYVVVPERVPELIVPDLTDCKLKPYVSYRAPDVIQSEFTYEDLFNVVYAKKIRDDFKAGKLDESGNPLEPSYEEKLTPDEAWVRARKTGSDIFEQRSKREEEEMYDLT